MSVATVGDIIGMMEQWAPPGWACSWDRIGLHTGTPEQEVRGVLICLSVTRTVFAAACKMKADLILTHHPLIWEPLTTLSPRRPHTRLCLDIHAAGMACYAAHTNLDVAPDGVNAALARTLKLEHIGPLFPVEHASKLKLVTFVPGPHLDRVRNALANAGAGHIGNYSHCSFNVQGKGTFLPGAGSEPFCGEKNRINEEEEWRLEMILDRVRLSAVLAALPAAHPYEEPAYDIYPLSNANPEIALGLRGALRQPCSLREFSQRVSRQLRVPAISVAGNPAARIRTVAVLGGSGGNYVHRIPEDIDAYVTGDVSFHDFEAALERNLALLDAGHEATERPVLQTIRHNILRAFPSVRAIVHSERKRIRFLVAHP